MKHACRIKHQSKRGRLAWFGERPELRGEVKLVEAERESELAEGIVLPDKEGEWFSRRAVPEAEHTCQPHDYSLNLIPI